MLKYKIILFLIIIMKSVFSSDLTVSLDYYEYEEKVKNSYFMSDKSNPALFSFGLRDWKIKEFINKKLNWIYTTEVTFGEVYYDSPSSGNMDTYYYKIRLENYLAIKNPYTLTYTPFIGLGYRVLYDDSGGRVSTKGHYGYDRMSSYLYCPLGLIYKFSPRTTVKYQYNYFIKGKQNSYLSTASSAYTDIANDQNSGWGIDTNIDFEIKRDSSVFLFYRYWDIKDSDISTGTYANVLVFQAYEPNNTTIEYGLGYAWKF